MEAPAELLRLREGFGPSRERNPITWQLFFDKDRILFFYTYIMNNSQQQAFFRFFQLKGMLIYAFLN